MYIRRVAEDILNKLLALPKIIIILGARQVGKTTLIQHLLYGKNVVFLNLDIEVDKQRFLSIASISPQDAVRGLGNPDIIVIDEAQRLVETGRIVKGWYDAKISSKIVLLGSSSIDLADRTAESLTGRNLKLFLPPFIFEEILSVQQWYSKSFSAEKIQNDFQKQINEILMQSLVFGNYPETVITEDKPGFLLNLVSDYLLKDILQMGLVKTPDLIKRLLMLLAHQICSEVSVNEIATGLGISRITIERYLDLLERTFVIFRLPAFSTNPRKEITKSSKIYFWDNGVRNALLNEFSVNSLRPDIGALWENWVVAEFAKQNIQSGMKKNLYFWRSRDGGEVDLIIKEGETLFAYEIKWKQQNIHKKSFVSRYKVPVEVIDSTKPILPFIMHS